MLVMIDFNEEISLATCSSAKKRKIEESGSAEKGELKI
jgi:hypothetical protein